MDVEYTADTYQTITATGALVPQVKALLSDIYAHLKSNTPLTPEEVGLIGLTQSPVFAVISANAQEGLGIQGLDTLAQMVATDMLADYLSNALDVIESSLAGTQLDKNNVQSLVQSVQTARDYVTQFDTQTRARFQQALTINLNVQKMMSQAMANLSPELRMASEGQQ
jgi:conjugative transfer pilus assembly protein TraH